MPEEKVNMKSEQQKLYEFLEEKSKAVKAIYEEIEKNIGEFLKTHKVELEYPIMVEGKKKYFRVFVPKGQFVYNRMLDTGVRVTPENPVKEA